MAGRLFTSTYDLETRLHEWMKSYANCRIHGTTKQIPCSQFIKEEKNLLQPLPDVEFSFYESYERITAINCHICLDNNYYSVPYQYVDKLVEVRTDKNLVRIYADNEEIAIHAKSNVRVNILPIIFTIRLTNVIPQPLVNKNMKNK